MPSEAQSVVLLGTGSYVPERVVTNHDLAQIVDTSDEWIQARTGIRERRFAAENEHTSDLATAAGNLALENSGADRSGIDLIIVATMTPDMPFPSTACLVQNKMRLPEVTAFDLQAACTGFVYALTVAESMLLSGRFNKALVIGAEKITPILDFQDRSTCVLFGDGAGAAVLGRSTQARGGILGSFGGSDGANPSLLCQPGGGSALPASAASVADGSHFLKMNGKEIFKIAVRLMEQATLELLERHNLKPGDVDLLIPHQANMRIIDSLLKRLGLPPEKSFNNLDRYGNTSAASIPIALDEARRAGRLKPEDLVLLVGFGAGLTWASSLIRWV